MLSQVYPFDLRSFSVISFLLCTTTTNKISNIYYDFCTHFLINSLLFVVADAVPVAIAIAIVGLASDVM